MYVFMGNTIIATVIEVMEENTTNQQHTVV